MYPSVWIPMSCHVGDYSAGDAFRFEVVFIQHFSSHCPNLQYSNSLTENKHNSPEFLPILVSADLILPALRKISHSICLYLLTRDLNPSANLSLLWACSWAGRGSLLEWNTMTWDIWTFMAPWPTEAVSLPSCEVHLWGDVPGSCDSHTLSNCNSWTFLGVENLSSAPSPKTQLRDLIALSGKYQGNFS